MKEALAGVGNLKIGRRINNKVRFADDTSVIPRRATRSDEQVGLHWKEVWSRYQHLQIASDESIQE